LVARNSENGNFAKLKYVPPFAKKTTLEPGEQRENIADTIKYISTQPLDQRKKGFGTRDANRRDEFCNDIRTEQYRETLRKEKSLNAESADVIQEKLAKLMGDKSKFDTMFKSGSMDDSQSLYGTRVRQFDIGRTRITPFDPKSTKDTFYKFGNTEQKRFGETPKPASTEVGGAAWEVTYKPPTYGGRSEVKNFYDKSHLNTSSY
jgi:hypothetical protein